jgi:hypothetical protein
MLKGTADDAIARRVLGLRYWLFSSTTVRDPT